MNKVTKFFHEMFNPHCEHCLEEKELTLERDIIEFLKQENSELRLQIIELVKRLTYIPEQEVKEVVNEEPKKIGSPFLTWRAKRQMLEAEDRAKVIALKNAAKPDTIENIERDLKIEPVVEKSEEELNNNGTENL